MSKTLPAYFTRFLLIGVSGTAAHFAVLIVGVTYLKIEAVLCSQIGAAVGAFVNYILSRQFNYQIEGGHVSTGSKFFIVSILGFVLNGVCMSLFTGHLMFDYLSAQCLTTGLVLFWSFGANHLWTFASRR